MDWGMKDILVPLVEARQWKRGKRYLVYLYIDEKNRLVASSKKNQLLK
jgi:predicted RNA-binding protein (virulence factor B family)